MGRGGDGGREEGREDEKHEIGKDRYRKLMVTFLHTDNVWVVGTCTVYLLQCSKVNDVISAHHRYTELFFMCQMSHL